MIGNGLTPIPNLRSSVANAILGNNARAVAGSVGAVNPANTPNRVKPADEGKAI